MLPIRRLGSMGPQISVLGLGTWAIGGPYEFGWGPVDDDESVATIRFAIEAGMNWIDTAPVYGRGHSEEVVGRALRSFRAGEDVLVFTKCGRNYYGSDKISSDLRPETITRECDESLRRLGLDRIDLLQIHWPDLDTGTTLEDSWAAMGELIQLGKVRWAGVSNFDMDQLRRCESIRHVDSLQPPLNILNPAARKDVIPWCRQQGVGVIAYAPLANGMLTGKFNRQATSQLAPDDWRRRSPNFNEPALSRNLQVIDGLRPLASNLGVDLTQLAVAWVLSAEGVTGAIVGARTAGQARGWLRAASISLSESARAEIKSIVEAAGIDTSGF
jgi:aryl-alcohol dehydrogenase-like predicted oxidoreductase